MTRPRVLLADDYPGMVTAVSRLLSLDCEVVGTVTDASALLESAQQLPPDVIVLDLNLPDLSGLEACRQLTQAHPQMKVIVLYGCRRIRKSSNDRWRSVRRPLYRNCRPSPTCSRRSNASASSLNAFARRPPVRHRRDSCPLLISTNRSIPNCCASWSWYYLPNARRGRVRADWLRSRARGAVARDTVTRTCCAGLGATVPFATVPFGWSPTAGPVALFPSTAFSPPVHVPIVARVDIATGSPSDGRRAANAARPITHALAGPYARCLRAGLVVRPMRCLRPIVAALDGARAPISITVEPCRVCA